MPACSDALLSDPAYGALVVPQTLAFEMYKSRLDSLGMQSEHHGKITCSVLISNWLQGPGTWEAERDTHVALFRSMDRCFRTIRAWHHRADLTQRGERVVKRRSDFGAAAHASRLIAEAANDRLTERESKSVLELYAIPAVRELGADSLDASLHAATELELVVGARIDPLFGPLIVAGFGGVLVELLRDSTVELAPINADEALRMLHRLKGAALFGGFRGGPAVDLDRLADLLVRVSEFAADQQGLIAELDINPVICTGSTLTAVDALIVRAARANTNIA
jgi:acetate---CoA ligase (ADP-forming)